MTAIIQFVRSMIPLYRKTLLPANIHCECCGQVVFQVSGTRIVHEKGMPATFSRPASEEFLIDLEDQLQSELHVERLAGANSR